MRFATQIAIPATFAALAAAAASNVTSASNAAPATVSMFLPGADKQTLYASAVGATSSVTTFLVACPSGAPAASCGFPEPFTAIEGPSTVSYGYSNAAESYAYNAHCDISTSSAKCTATQQGGNKPGTQTWDVAVNFMPITVIAGQENLAMPTGAAAGNGTVAASGAKPTSTGAQATGSAATGNAAPRATGAVAGFGGVLAAAVVAAVAM